MIESFLSLILVQIVSGSVFKDYQKWPELCNDPHEFCFGEKNNVTTSNITEGCLSKVATAGSFTYNSDCRIFLRVSLSLSDDDDHRNVQWRIRIPSNWNIIHLTIWFSPLSNLTTNEECHSIKIIDDKSRQFSKGYGYYKFDGLNFETDQGFDDDGIMAPKSRYSIINLEKQFHGNNNYSSNFTNSPLFNFIWFNFRSFTVLEMDRFASDSINLIHDKLYIYMTLKGKDEDGNLVEIIGRRSDEAVQFFPIHVTDEEALADSTLLAIIGLIAFAITMIILAVYVCMTRERHETISSGVDVTRDEPNQESKTHEKVVAEHRMKIKKHDESHVSIDGLHHGMEHGTSFH